MYVICTKIRIYWAYTKCYFLLYLWNMNKWWKNALAVSGAFIVYKFYKLYELGESVVYEPYKYRLQYSGGNTPNLVVTMKLFNPTSTAVNMRSVFGEISVDGNVLSSYDSGAFTIKPGTQYFDLVFSIQTPAAKQYFNSFFANSNRPLKVVVKKRLPFFTTTDEYLINVKSLIFDSLTE
jgi:hypothetical protein